jgi:hypothetical protein
MIDLGGLMARSTIRPDWPVRIPLPTSVLLGGFACAVQCADLMINGRAYLGGLARRTAGCRGRTPAVRTPQEPS